MQEDHTANQPRYPAETDRWIAPFGDRFIGLDENATIRRAIGAFTIPPATGIEHLHGLPWRDFVTHFAAPDAQAGLRHLWHAIAEARVAPDFWPAVVPFAAEAVARLRRVSGDPDITYAVHIQPALQCSLDTLIGTQTPDATQRLIQLAQNLARGMHGPLTDSQVETVNTITTLSEAIDRLLDDLRTAITMPATQAPLPHAVNTLLAFAEHDFAAIRRISVQRLGLRVDLPDDVRVYCYPAMRDVVRGILERLLEGIEAQSTITLTSQQETSDTVRIAIAYNARTPALYSTSPVHPLDLGDAARFQPSTVLQRLVTTAQAHVSPVNGQVWAKPTRDDDAHNMQIGIILPRWKDNRG